MRDQAKFRSGFGVFLTVALYLSGLFVLLTPLAPLYHLLCDRRRAVVQVILPALAAVVLLYVLALYPLHEFYQRHSGWSWIMPIPGMNLIGFTSIESAILFGLVYFVFFMGVALVLQRVLTHSVSLTRWLGGATFSFFVFSIFLYVGYSLWQGVSPVGFIEHYFHTAILEFIRIQEEAGLPLSRLAFLKENIDLFVRFSLLFSPSVLFCSILFVLVLNLMVGRKLFAPFQAAIQQMRLNRWVFEFYWVWVVIGCLALLLINSYFIRNSVLLAIPANILLVLVLVYFLQGLGIVSFFFEKKGVGPFIRMMTYALMIVLFQTLGIVVMALGFFDSWFDFRKLSSPKKETNGG